MAGPDDAPKYDVALSFWSKRGLKEAAELHDRLSSGLSVFFFPRNQEELAGTDGMETMRLAFRAQSRLNVVLYAGDWGETPWTRVERTAITDRCLEDGWRTLFFIMLDGALRPPKWLPDSYVYFLWDDYGLAGAVGAIKARVQELGGQVRPETLADRAARAARKITLEAERKRFRDSEDGVNSIRAAFEEVKAAIRAGTVDARNALPEGSRFDLTDDRDGSLILVGVGGAIKIRLETHYRNSLDGTSLLVEKWSGHPAMTGTYTIDSKRVGYTTFEIELDDEGNPSWTVGRDRSRFMTSTDLAERILNEYLDRAVRLAEERARERPR